MYCNFHSWKYVLYCNTVLPKIRTKNRHLCTEAIIDTPGFTKYKLYESGNIIYSLDQVLFSMVWIQCTQELSRCSKVRASYWCIKNLTIRPLQYISSYLYDSHDWHSNLSNFSFTFYFLTNETNSDFFSHKYFQVTSNFSIK